MASGSVATLAEQRLARKLLGLLGLSARRIKDPQNVLAIVAWMRVAAGPGVRFNNIFMVRAGQAGASRYAKGTYLYKGTYYVKFRSQADAFRAAAFIIKNGRKGSPLWMALRALRFGRGGDFLALLASSDWSNTNILRQLTKARKGLLSLAQVARMVKRIVKQVRRGAAPPPTIGPPPAVTPYLDPYEAGRFYDERHPHDEVPSTP